MIKVFHLNKHFRIAQPGQGVAGKLRALIAPQYKTIRAVDDISYTIRAGEIIGYLGPNGAGKSTTIKLLTGVLVPTSGEVRVGGREPHRNRIANASQIGVVYGQRSQLWWDLPLVDSFEIFAAMYRVPSARYRQVSDELVALLQMDDFLNQPVRRLSLGQRMKGEIVAALLHEPPILYLDEPTIGLDVVAKNRILQFLQTINAQKGTTIVFTTHALSDVERICPRIIIIDRGKVALDDSREAILNRFGRMRQLVVEFEDYIQPVALPAGRVIKQENNNLTIEFDREQISAFDLILSLKDQTGIRDIAIKEENIETIVTRLYEQAAR